MKLEVCVDSYTSMLTAIKAGADRIELCSALNLGGLTPSYGLMQQAKDLKEIEIFVMIRPRSGDFLYDTHELETMKQDIKIVKQLGFDGIVTGILQENGCIDIKRMKELVKEAYPLNVVFHRAFDCAKEPMNDLEQLIEMGICRILTSGQRKTALEGVSLIAQLQERFGNLITIMPGGGINDQNIEEIHRLTKCSNFHLSGRIKTNSLMTYRECINQKGTSLSDFIIEKADYDSIKKVKTILNKFENLN